MVPPFLRDTEPGRITILCRVLSAFVAPTTTVKRPEMFPRPAVTVALPASLPLRLTLLPDVTISIYLPSETLHVTSGDVFAVSPVAV